MVQSTRDRVIKSALVLNGPICMLRDFPRGFGWLLADSPHISAHSYYLWNQLQYFGVQTQLNI